MLNTENLKQTEETTLSRIIRTAEDKAAYDAACKRILAHKRILAWILRECAEEYQDCSLEDIENRYIEKTPQVGSVPVLPDDEPDQLPIIRGIGTEDGSLFEQAITFDVRFRALAPKDDGCITLLVNAEGQQAYAPGYPLSKRGIYYCSRMISSQYAGRNSTAAATRRSKRSTASGSAWTRRSSGRTPSPCTGSRR